MYAIRHGILVLCALSYINISVHTIKGSFAMSTAFIHVYINTWMVASSKTKDVLEEFILKHTIVAWRSVVVPALWRCVSSSGRATSPPSLCTHTRVGHWLCSSVWGMPPQQSANQKVIKIILVNEKERGLQKPNTIWLPTNQPNHLVFGGAPTSRTKLDRCDQSSYSLFEWQQIIRGLRFTSKRRIGNQQILNYLVINTV